LRAYQDHLLAHWSEPAAHDAFVDHAFALDQGWQAAAFYRAQLAIDDHRDVAKRRLDWIQLRALAMFEVPKDRKPPKMPLWLWFVGIGVCVALIVWVAQYAGAIREIWAGFEVR
jgi:hypothetical protein